MRNYIQTYWQSFDQYDISDPMNPVLIGSTTHVSNNQEEAAAWAAANSSAALVAQDAGFPAWILIDKAAIIFALNSGATFQNSCNMQFVSPRKPAALPNWPNNDGDPAGPTYNQHLGDEKRFKSQTGDFSGANGLVDWLNALALYAAQLRASGRVRDAGIVQFAYDQVKKGLWSITEAAQYLHDNGLV